MSVLAHLALVSVARAFAPECNETNFANCSATYLLPADRINTLDLVCESLQSLWACAVLHECNTSTGLASWAIGEVDTSNMSSTATSTTLEPVERRRLLEAPTILTGMFTRIATTTAASLRELRGLPEKWSPYDEQRYRLSLLETGSELESNADGHDAEESEDERTFAVSPRSLQYDDRRRRSSRAPTVTIPPCNRSSLDCNYTTTTTMPPRMIPRGSLRDIQCERLSTLGVVARGRCTMEWRALLFTFECEDERDSSTRWQIRLLSFCSLVYVALL